MTSKSVLVTGGSGFLGSRIVRALVEKYPEWTVTVLDLCAHDESLLPSRVRYVEADVTSLSAVVETMQEVKPDIVVHAAGMIPPLSERYRRRLQDEVFRVNVQGTRNVVTAAQQAGCRALVYTSSCCAVTDDLSRDYPNIDESWPTVSRASIYAESKVQAEAVVLAANSHSMKTCVLRPAVIFGEGDRQLIPSLYACIAKGESPYRIGSGTNLWDTVYVGNVADAHVLAVEHLISARSAAAGEVFFIQNNEPVSFREFSLEIWKNFGHYPSFEMTIPKQIAWTMGLLTEGYTWLSGASSTLSRGSVLDACAISSRVSDLHFVAAYETASTLTQHPGIGARLRKIDIGNISLAMMNQYHAFIIVFLLITICVASEVGHDKPQPTDDATEVITLRGDVVPDIFDGLKASTNPNTANPHPNPSSNNCTDFSPPDNMNNWEITEVITTRPLLRALRRFLNSTPDETSTTIFTQTLPPVTIWSGTSTSLTVVAASAMTPSAPTPTAAGTVTTTVNSPITTITISSTATVTGGGGTQKKPNHTVVAGAVVCMAVCIIGLNFVG